MHGENLKLKKIFILKIPEIGKMPIDGSGISSFIVR